MMLYYQRRYADAVTLSERALALNPRIGHTVRGRALAALGRFPDAIAALTEAVTLSGRNPSLVAELGRTYAAAGLREQAEAVLTELLNQRSGPGASGPPSDGIAYLHAALGRPAEAMTWLERAFDENTAAILWLRVDPRADSLRAQPRFEMLLQRIGRLP
jgi:tetratricopeptide (TPR) repeat protein